MERRDFIKSSAFAAAALYTRGGFSVSAKGSGAAGPRKPVFVYNNWSAYDELSDKVVQTEELAMRELGEIVRLQRSGVRIDYYVMDAFWFDKNGGYRTWHREHWPQGPDRWLAGCKEHGIRPGMWFSTNLIATHDGRFLEPVAEWADSVATDPNILCLFEGGYLNHLAGTLQLWYDRGVRLFKFDFAYFEAVTAAAKDKYTPEEIKEKNKVAFMGMLRHFRERNPDVLITGYNGFGGEMENTFTPFHQTVDHRWLDVFDTIYCGDPRFSDVPMMNIWRSQDNYSDHMVRQFAFNGLPLRRIDNCAFMIGKTGTCYYRATHAWKGMLLLELARGGWMNVYHGNLELLDTADAEWFARVQRIYQPLQARDGIAAFGAIPGTGKPYWFRGNGPAGRLYTVVNPGQEIATVDLGLPAASRVLYADAGFRPVVSQGALTLGSEQLAVVGTGGSADAVHDLGTDDGVRVPIRSEKVAVDFVSAGKNKIVSSIKGGGTLRILFQQFDKDGFPVRSWGGSPPDGRKMNELLRIVVRQGGRELPLVIEYDKMIWSGLSWGAGELKQDSYDPSAPVEIECTSSGKDELRLEARVYRVEY
jgi:hypothetical protein